MLLRLGQVVLSCALATTFAACHSDATLGPADVAGTYALRTVGGVAAASLDSYGTAGRGFDRLIDEQITLAGDGTLVRRQRREHSPGYGEVYALGKWPPPDTAEVRTTGTWSLGSGRLTIAFSAPGIWPGSQSAGPFAGAVAGSRGFVYQDTAYMGASVEKAYAR